MAELKTASEVVTLSYGMSIKLQNLFGLQNCNPTSNVKLDHFLKMNETFRENEFRSRAGVRPIYQTFFLELWSFTAELLPCSHGPLFV